MRRVGLFAVSLAVLLVTMLSNIAHADVSSHYLNPLMKGADPTIERQDDGYYYSAAGDGNVVLKRHETILGVSTAKSKEVWKLPEDLEFIWGPDAHRIDGKWYIYFASGPKVSDEAGRFAYGHPSSYVLENSSPDPFEGTWELKGTYDNGDGLTPQKGLLNTQSYGLPTGFVTIKGQRYMTYTKYFYFIDPTTGKERFDECPTIVKMKNPWTLEGEEITLARPTYDWEKYVDNVNEGAAVVERNGKVFFAYSASSYTHDNYAVGLSWADLAQSVENEAAWHKHPEPIMKRSDENGSYSTGSPLFLKSEDGTEDWITYHGIPTHSQGGKNREVRAQRINWDDNDFINLGIPSNPGTVLSRPSGEEKSEVYEAEDAQLSGAVRATMNSIYASSGRYARYSNSADSDYVEFTVDTQAGGIYSLDFRYNNNTAEPITMTLGVNQEAPAALVFPSNAGPEKKLNFDLKTVHNIRLNEGSNIVRLSGKSALGLDAIIAKKSVLYEAESAQLSGGAVVAQNHAGYSGSGYASGFTEPNAAVSFTVNAPRAGSYSVKLAYGAGGEDDGTLTMYVNGVKIKQANFFGLKAWDKWADRYDNVFLKEGGNVITYKYDNGDAADVNLDYITVTEAATWTYEAESAHTTGGADAGIVQAQDGNTGTGYVSGLSQANSSVEFSVDAEYAASYDLKLRYATEQGGKTLSLEVNGAPVQDIVLPHSGGAGIWKEYTVTVPLNKGKNSIAYKNAAGDSGVIRIDHIHLNKRTPWKYQAEAAALSGTPGIGRDRLWFEGNGYVGLFQKKGDAVRFEVNVPYTAAYTSTLRYSGVQSTNRTMTLYVNGNRVKQVSLPPTANWDTWMDATETVHLQAGKNSIEFRREEGDTGQLNIDSLTLDKFSGGFMSTKAKELTPEKMVKIQPKHSGKALSVAGEKYNQGAAVIQFSNGETNSQLMRFVDLGTGYYRILIMRGARFLDIKPDSGIQELILNQTMEEAPIPSDSEQWRLEKDGDYYKIINKSNGKVITVNEASKGNNAVIRLADDEGKDHQRFKIELRNLYDNTFYAVSDISAVPDTAQAGQELTLFGTVSPDWATRKSIAWSIKDAGQTRAVLDGNVLTATRAGTVIVTATIEEGSDTGVSYSKDFTITVSKKDADVSPEKATYDLYVPGDVSTGIIWNEAKSVTGVVYAATVAGAVYNGALTTDDYTVSGDMLTIKRETMAAWGLQKGDTVDFSIQFNQGNPAVLSVNVVDSFALTSHLITVAAEGHGIASANVPSAVKDTAITLTATPDPGQLFKGWKVISPGSLRVTDNTFIMPDEAVAITAIFGAPSYGVTYNGNGAASGHAPVDNSSYEQGVTVSVYGNTGNLEKPGYVFAGWNVRADGSGAGYTEGQTFTMGGANVTLYAQWTAKQSGGSSGGGSDEGDSSGGSSPSATAGKEMNSVSSSQFTVPADKKGEYGLGDEIKIEIPAGASRKEFQLSISKITDTQKLLAGQAAPASPVFELRKDFPGDFDKEITLTLAFDPARIKKGQQPAVFAYDEAQKNWRALGGQINGAASIAVKVSSVAKFAVFGVDQAANPPAPKPAVNLSDLAAHWAETDVKQAIDLGIVSGYPDGTFKPDRTVTRAEFAVMLIHALKPQENRHESAPLTFTDKEQIGAWAMDAVEQAVRAGIISGYEDGSFRPDAEMTRSEMAKMIASALGQSGEGAATAGFADDAAIPDWAKDAVAVLSKRGIMEGKGGNQFAPGDQATRAEAIRVLLNMLSYRK
ncbi:Listeria/Bacterioides repeat-containing protein [Paenibacillus sp. UNCCL117]|uniref:S-layer homology domain-containing protein n=1 Tax=unclassified Paenibacillus TaxID=185978 RepID=UPI00088212A3|nr:MULTISPECIES: CBM35 domain-containing protein [unclassified Paenibacillus]SDE40601.1 Listeria/Bacterioides repeat-containing protein [Paenibacillus sp. cl123]SFW65366.1 Listeria/Bacterioides repeat-containing protein [Paenibacillus sp. UNCCL117]